MNKYKNTIVEKDDLGLWEGDIAPILDEQKEVDIRWKGAKIPGSIILECLKWFRMVDQKYSSEAQARLLYNAETQEWGWLAYPQYVTAGLYSQEITPAECNDEQQKMRDDASKDAFDKGFREAGTIHSHCDAGAFASGTDDKDEISQNGIHITLGKINDEAVEIHGRVVFRKIKYNIHWNDWIVDCGEGDPACWSFKPGKLDEIHIDEDKLMALCFKKELPKYTPFSKGSGYGFGWQSGGYGGMFGSRDKDSYEYMRGWDDAGWGTEIDQLGEGDKQVPESTFIRNVIQLAESQGYAFEEFVTALVGYGLASYMLDEHDAVLAIIHAVKAAALVTEEDVANP